MMSLIKYLLPFILAASVWGGADVSADVAEDDVIGFVISSSLNQTSISSSESEFCLPRQVSYANTLRLAGGARRTGSMQRNNLEFAKSGKVINAGIRYLVQNNSIDIHSAGIEPSYRLICLGRLII